MAGDWIKMRGNLWDDPRVSRLCDLTNQAEATIIGGLYWLWATADQHSADGFMPGLTVRQIDRKSSIDGFGKALCDVGWLIEEPHGIRIARFEEHNGTSAKRRCVEAQRKANGRKLSASDADILRTQSGQNAPDCGAREEKKREEIITNPNGLVVASNAERPDCPHQEIIALYHEILPTCPRVRDWTPTRAKQLRARWNEDPARQNLDWWSRFFTYIRESDFLMGRTVTLGREPFIASLAWITKSANFTKIREGNYENRVSA
jgi:hypothetical protein